MQKQTITIIIAFIFIGCGGTKMSQSTMKSPDLTGIWGLVGMYVNNKDKKETPSLIFENLMIQQSGNQLKLLFQETSPGIPTLEGNGGQRFENLGTIQGNEIAWTCRRFYGEDAELVIDFKGSLSEDGRTFMGTGNWTSKADDQSEFGTITLAGELTDE